MSKDVWENVMHERCKNRGETDKSRTVRISWSWWDKRRSQSVWLNGTISAASVAVRLPRHLLARLFYSPSHHHSVHHVISVSLLFAHLFINTRLSLSLCFYVRNTCAHTWAFPHARARTRTELSPSGNVPVFYCPSLLFISYYIFRISFRFFSTSPIVRAFLFFYLPSCSSALRPSLHAHTHTWRSPLLFLSLARVQYNP